MYSRYAIFYTPPAGSLADFGAAWLGWDSAAGREVRQPDVEGLDLSAITAPARRYGFHATLKAPFRLAEGRGEADLARALDTLAATQPAVDAGHLVLGATHDFAALRCMRQPEALTALAARVVRELDGFRAPLTDADIARRRKAGLTPAQDARMLEWGYPWVFEDFAFHMTLSGPLGDARKPVIGALVPRVGAVMGPSLLIEGLTLMGEDVDGLFHQLHRAPLLLPDNAVRADGI